MNNRQWQANVVTVCQPREKQVEIDQLQYELGAVKRRTDTEVCSLRQRISDLELQVSETRKEADEYYRASVECNTEAMALANQVTFTSMIQPFGVETFSSVIINSRTGNWERQREGMVKRWQLSLRQKYIVYF